MADASSTLGRALLSFSETRDIDEFVDMLSRFERGEVDADAWRAFRLLRGTYGQRQPGSVSMLRAKSRKGSSRRRSSSRSPTSPTGSRAASAT